MKSKRIVKPQVIFYARGNSSRGEHLRKFIEEAIPRGRLAVCRNPEDLLLRLSGTMKNGMIAVLAASDTEDLEAFASLRDHLREVKLILILPDGQKKTVEKGHTLRPRYISYLDADPQGLSAVLEKMI